MKPVHPGAGARNTRPMSTSAAENHGQASNPAPGPGGACPPCVLYEDEHLLVVHKPAGWNTHAPSPWAGEGIYDWLRNREPRWARLAIVQRLDKETSGVLVFSKTELANRSLTEQFSQHRVQKRYVFWTDRPAPRRAWTTRSALDRAGPRRISRTPTAHPSGAITRFEMDPEPVAITVPWAVGTAWPASLRIWQGRAWPVTGKTHQIRTHASAEGIPILGDSLYHGTPWARLCLHAEELELFHPATGRPIRFTAPADFLTWPGHWLRRAVIEPDLTDAHRCVHGAADGWPGLYLDRLGPCLLATADRPLTEPVRAWILHQFPARALYYKPHPRRPARLPPDQVAPGPVHGVPVSEPFLIRENGLRFELSLREGGSVGLFLDQRDNRRRLLTGYVGRGFWLRDPARTPQTGPWTVLNTFAYTCGFSVAAARAGARVTSVDLSRKYLDWGRRNFLHNGLDPAAHDFLQGDVRDWFRRWQRQGRTFDLILLDPPTFSRSKSAGVFQVEKDLPGLVTAAVTLLRPGGVLFVSSNKEDWSPADFTRVMLESVRAAGRNLLQHLYVPQPPDFPIHRDEPGYLKTLWCRVE